MYFEKPLGESFLTITISRTTSNSQFTTILIAVQAIAKVGVSSTTASIVLAIPGLYFTSFHYFSNSWKGNTVKKKKKRKKKVSLMNARK